MVAPSRNCTDPARLARRAGRPLTLAAALALAALAQVSPATAQGPRAQNDGIFLPVPSRINDDAVSQIEAKIKDALKRQKAGSFTVILDFNPDGQPVGTRDVYACMRLMRYLRGLRQQHANVKTVAFVHNEVTQHTVLPVLACTEMVMSKKASIGKVLDDQQGGLHPEARLPPEAREAYDQVARDRPSPDIVWKMIYADMALRELDTTGGPRYVDDRTAQDPRALDKALQRMGVKLKAKGSIPAKLGIGNTSFDSETARKPEYGLCKQILNTGGEVVRAYGLPPYALHEHAMLGRTRVGWRVDLTSTVNKAKLDSLERRVKQAVGRGANVLILYLDCEGGDTVDVVSTARMLSGLKDDAGALPVMTIAYVPPRRALGAATFLALGCSQIVMAKESFLGDFDYLKNSGDKLAAARDMLVNLAEERGYPAALFRDTMQPNDKGEFTKISARVAGEQGIARYADVENVEDLYKRAELDPAKVRVSRDDWLDKVAEFFREEVVKLFLIMIGIAGLILELKMPGTGFPGVVAAVCFVLFFWAHSFVGEFTMLAVFLFLLGLVLIGLEIFVVPGFGVTGISGIVLVVASLVLVTLERMPETSQDWVNLGATVTTLGISLVAAIVGACVLAWYLPHIPYASRLVLQPPGENEQDADGDAFGGRPEAAAALLGAIGVAATTLRPAGKARFGDDYLDVVAEGDYVNPGSRVQVVEIEGNRIVVKEV
jgi:membrane-bound serine protease (ClpP class)